MDFLIWSYNRWTQTWPTDRVHEQWMMQRYVRWIMLYDTTNNNCPEVNAD